MLVFLTFIKGRCSPKLFDMGEWKRSLSPRGYTQFANPQSSSQPLKSVSLLKDGVFDGWIKTCGFGDRGRNGEG